MSFSDTKIPRVWVLIGLKAGDNTQLRALAGALGWPCEEKRLVHRATELVTNLALRVTLAGIDRARSSPLVAPWPDLVLTAGRRNEPVARWIRARSGDRARIVHVGRPWTHPSRFDLIVTTPQYRVRPASNVLINELPLHDVTPAGLSVHGDAWRERFARLPRPWVALLVGGHSGPYTFSTGKARALGEQAVAMAQREGGSLLVTGSARTPRDVMATLVATLDVPAFVHGRDDAPGENPYRAFLALADAFIVTGDSVSMLAEACATGKAVHVFDLAGRPQDRARPAALLHRLLMRIAPRRMRRDVAALQQALVREGRIAWLGAGTPAAPRTAGSGDLDRAVARVRALF